MIYIIIHRTNQFFQTRETPLLSSPKSRRTIQGKTIYIFIPVPITFQNYTISKYVIIKYCYDIPKRQSNSNDNNNNQSRATVKRSKNINMNMSLEKVSSFAPLPIRVMAGIAFIIHGLPKFENIQGTQGFFGSVGLPPELALPIALLEVIGGIALILGIFTRIAAILFAIEMGLITLIIKSGGGFTTDGGYELDLLLMSIAISLLLSGPGRISIERDILKREIFPKASYKQKQINSK